MRKSNSNERSLIIKAKKRHDSHTHFRPASSNVGPLPRSPSPSCESAGKGSGLSLCTHAPRMICSSALAIGCSSTPIRQKGTRRQKEGSSNCQPISGLGPTTRQAFKPYKHTHTHTLSTLPLFQYFRSDFCAVVVDQTDANLRARSTGASTSVILARTS